MGRPKGSKNKRPYIRTRGNYGVPPKHKALLEVFSKLGIIVTGKMASRIRSGWRGHKERAARYGIPFLLTFEQWLTIWYGSGHLFERGSRSGQYHMARWGDQGAYVIGNVSIQLGTKNNREACARNSEAHLIRLSDNNYVRGKVWITDGVVERRMPPSRPLPDGWCLGRLAKTNAKILSTLRSRVVEL